MARADPVQGRRAHADHRLVAAPVRGRRARITCCRRDADEIVRRVPALAAAPRRRSPAAPMLCRRTEVFPDRVRDARLPLRLGVEGVPRSAARWPASRFPPGLRESDRLDPPVFSPATKAETGPRREHHDRAQVREHRRRGRRPRELERLSRLVYERGRAHRRRARNHHRRHEVRVRARCAAAASLLIDEVLTPDSSRFWPADQYQPGRVAAELRQAAAARLSRRRAPRRSLERRRAAAAAARRGRRRDQRALPRRVPPHHRQRRSTGTELS